MVLKIYVKILYIFVSIPYFPLVYYTPGTRFYTRFLCVKCGRCEGGVCGDGRPKLSFYYAEVTDILLLSALDDT